MLKIVTTSVTVAVTLKTDMTYLGGTLSSFGTILPLWSNEIKIKNRKHEIQVWTFNNKWGKQILFYKLFEVTDEKRLEELI